MLKISETLSKYVEWAYTKLPPLDPGYSLGYEKTRYVEGVFVSTYKKESNPISWLIRKIAKCIFLCKATEQDKADLKALEKMNMFFYRITNTKIATILLKEYTEKL